MVATIAKWGNSLAIRIPQNLAKEINLAEGSQVQLVLIDGKLTIEPITRRRYSLEELIEAITPENVHTEVDTGVAVGNEVW
ncbi:AbrB/MazE/SpoVT family DNA-binding domain-containing protein [Tychonema sp. LEGE 07199]|uniref:AbrB/MazE/SpoVT family DNA-binding domain-containing protein n=1 Tax=unclassified Tychonema TaxID=2642144 RepID=UPI00187E0489|nr:MULTISPECIES: AbrB/MazE/SpoVT family DNA-binding domain-containing protein [unclassified Tychonema]MBE9124036.1 AbrB/MazE/SpoVT family DNA-binding domain-containing protein [Tychonema sp. LEGE 07199]MBE9130298.1 AbrB/MazE/SpoVT family DNA-binding domain-containing protein [Tychonema sp. LEGE 07196]